MPYLSEVERGRKEASSEVLAAVCDALRIELADLLAEVGATSRRPAHRAPVVPLDVRAARTPPAPVAAAGPARLRPLATSSCLAA